MGSWALPAPQVGTAVPIAPPRGDVRGGGGAPPLPTATCGCMRTPNRQSRVMYFDAPRSFAVGLGAEMGDRPDLCPGAEEREDEGD